VARCNTQNGIAAGPILSEAIGGPEGTGELLDKSTELSFGDGLGRVVSVDVQFGVFFGV
jgi:hypothetical protein